jgi:hypothetical protein
MPPKKIERVEAQDGVVPIIVIDEEEDKKNRAERKFQAFLHNTDEKELIVENLKLFIQELVRYKNMSSLRILDLGCGTGEVPSQLTNALLKDHPAISIVYRGLDINAESVSATQTRLNSLSIDAQVMVGDCFKRENVESLIQKERVDIVLISHVVYWGDIGDVVQLISTKWPYAVLIFIHQHTSSFPSILRQKYSANLNSQVVNDIPDVVFDHEYGVTRVLMPASIDLSHRPLSEVMIRQASDLSSDAADERDAALFMLQRSTSFFPATPLLKAGADDIGEDKENVESPKMVSAKTPKTPLWRSVVHDIEEQKIDGNIIFWDVFHICTHDPLLLGFLNVVAKRAMSVLYKENDFQALATEENNDVILRELVNIRREQELWYTEDNINLLLRRYLHEDKYVVMAQTQFEHHGNLADNIVHAVRHVVTGRTAVLPINLHNNHWVGLVIRRLNPGVIQAIYVDPLGHDLTNEPNALVLRDALNNATNAFPGHNVEILVLSVQQQANSYDCGPFTVDNLVILAQTDLNTIEELEGILYRPETGNAIELREEHEALYDLTPEEYEVDFVGQANVLAEPGDTGIGELFALSWSGLFLSADS